MYEDATASAGTNDGPWTRDEVDAVLAVRKALVSKQGLRPEALGEVELITITCNAKFRVDDAVKKYMTYRQQLLDEYKIADVWAAPDVDGMDAQWRRLAVAGRDEGDRQIMWVQGGGAGTPVAEETPCIRACCQYFFAVHADTRTLRNGITLVINTGGKSSKVGNEKKLQVAWQNFPTRPQHVYILGTTTLMRVVINGLIAFASLFAKNKLVARVRFTDMAHIASTCGAHALPEAHGGDKRLPTKEWVRERLAAFPLMHLSEYV